MSLSTVSATIQDPSGQIFANGTWQLVFKSTYGTPGPFTDSGAAFTMLFGGSLDATGSFSQAVARNDTISPANSHWTLIVTPNANGQAFSVDLNVNSGAFNASAAINAVITNIVINSTPLAFAYKNSEINLAPNAGALYFDVTRISLKAFNPLTSLWSEFPANGGIINPSASFGRCFVDGVKYATLAAAYSDTVNCQDIYLPTNYSEVQLGGQFHFSRSNVNITCMGGNCVITNTAGWKIDPNANFHGSFNSDSPWAHSSNGTTFGLTFAGYTGAGVAFQVGDATASTAYVGFKNVFVSLASAAAGATAWKFFRTTFVDMDRPGCVPTADLQTCIDSDGNPGGAAFTGIINVRNMQFGAGAGGTNATCIRSGPIVSAFNVEGGNCTLLNAGSSVCFRADGGEMYLQDPNCNTAATGEITTKDAPSGIGGRISGRVRHDSGVGTPYNFGLGVVGSDIFCTTCSVANVGVDNSVNGFNSFKTPDSFGLNSNKWGIVGGVGSNGNFVVQDVLHPTSHPIDITSLGNTNLGTGTFGTPGTGGAQVVIGTNGSMIIGNTADAPANLIISSGLTTIQQAFIIFADHNVQKWNVGKLSDNSFAIQTSGGVSSFRTVAAGTTDIGAGTNKFSIDSAVRLFIGGAASDAGTPCPANQSAFWLSTINNRLKHCDNAGSQNTIADIVASGTATFTTTAVPAGTCQTTVTVAATNALTTDTIATAFATAPVAATDSLLNLNQWVTAGNVNFSRCNGTAASITPTALVLNWRVIR